MELGPPGALSPGQWGAQVDYDAWTDTYTPDDGVALHHGGGNDYRAGRKPYSQLAEIDQLLAWEDYHLSKGWWGLAYGWGIGQSGTIYRARGDATYGAHTGDVDGDGISNNTEQIPIIFIGSGHHHSLSPAAQDSLVVLRGWLEAQSGRLLTLRGHQELKGTATSCPGPKLMTYVRTHRLLEDTMPAPKDWDAEDLNAVGNAVLTRFAVRDADGNLVLVKDAIQSIYQHTKWTRAKLAGLVAGSASAGAIAVEIGQRLIDGG